MSSGFTELNEVYRRRFNKNKRNPSPKAERQVKNLYEEGKRYRFTLLNGQSYEGTVIKQSQYELLILAIGKGSLIIPKHSILYAEVL